MSVNRQTNVDLQEFSDTSNSVSTAATITAGLFTAQRPFRIDAVELASDVTIASSGTNYYTFALRVGGRTAATFTINGNAITAGLLAAMTLAAESGQNRVAAKGEVVDLVCTLTGTLTINIRCIVHGRYVG